MAEPAGVEGFFDARVEPHTHTQQLWAVVCGQAQMEVPTHARRDLRAPRVADVPGEEFAKWGRDCGDMFFFPEGALNILYSLKGKCFSVKLKYIGFAPDGYAKRVNACSHGEFYAAVRLLALVRDKWPRRFKTWVGRVCACVGSGGKLGVSPAALAAAAAAEAAGADGDVHIHLLSKAEEAQIAEWPQWPQPLAGKASAYLEALHAEVDAAARGRRALTWAGVWGAIKRAAAWEARDGDFSHLPRPVRLVRPPKEAMGGALSVTQAAVLAAQGGAAAAPRAASAAASNGVPPRRGDAPGAARRAWGAAGGARRSPEDPGRWGDGESWGEGDAHAEAWQAQAGVNGVQQQQQRARPRDAAPAGAANGAAGDEGRSHKRARESPPSPGHGPQRTPPPQQQQQQQQPSPQGGRARADPDRVDAGSEEELIMLQRLDHAKPPAAAPPTPAVAAGGESLLAARLQQIVERRVSALINSPQLQTAIDAALMARIEEQVDVVLEGPLGGVLLDAIAGRGASASVLRQQQPPPPPPAAGAGAAGVLALLGRRRPLEDRREGAGEGAAPEAS